MVTPTLLTMLNLGVGVLAATSGLVYILAHIDAPLSTQAEFRLTLHYPLYLLRDSPVRNLLLACLRKATAITPLFAQMEVYVLTVL